jgi:hypothetical protein
MLLNNKKASLRKKKRLFSGYFFYFSCGAFTGILISIVFIFSVVYLNSDGLNIYLNKEQIFNVISYEVDRQTQEEFPAFIQEVRSEVPFLVEKYIKEDFIRIGDLEIGGYTVELPEQLIGELEKDLRNDVTYYIYELLDTLEEEKFVNELSSSITGDVLNSLFIDLNGRKVSIPLTEHYSIPLRVWLE